MSRALESYIEELKSDVASLVYSDGEGASFEDKFTEYCLEVLESIGKVEGARVLSYIHPNRHGSIDWKINGYCLGDTYKDESNKSYFETLDLFITYYRTDEYGYSFNDQSLYNKTINQLKKFINGAFKRHIDYVDKSNSELYELIKILGKQGNMFDRINIYLLVNGMSNIDKESTEIKDLDVNIYTHTWDINRLFRALESNRGHEPIEVDFSKMQSNERGLQCIKVPNIDELYDCYLAIVPGLFLSDLYKEYSSELLESNVRSFLGQAGKFNRGIRDTIRTKPHMFLPYNNGITATAESVITKIEDNQLFITSMTDFQIVNGGQTTASLYHTQKKYKDVDLSKIFVQMKLTVIKDVEQKNVEVPNIARYANSQNKVSELDLSSNNPFLVEIENLSRKKYVINPENSNQSRLWFFERTNGQYREILNRKTPAQKRAFKNQSPTNMKFVKSDIAKFINIWELEPHFVSQGAQKNFIHFSKKINELVSKNRLPGENFYKKLIANAILFKTTDKLFGRKNHGAIGDTSLKSYTVAYTLSYFHFLTDNRFDLWRLYEEQKVDDAVQRNLKDLMIFVYNYLTTEAANSLISEYAKKATSWSKLKKVNPPFDLIEAIDSYLITDEQKQQREKEKDVNINNTEDSLFIVSEIREIGLRFWDGLKNYIKANNINEFNWTDSFELYSRLKKKSNLRARDISFGKNVLDYVQSNPTFVEEIRSLSKENEEDLVELKFVYDKLLLLSKEEWDRIIDFSSQTKIFDNLELHNVKSIRSSLLKRESVREQALLRAYESILKLSRYGIKI